MAGEEEQLETCQECGASIYPEHLENHVAEQWEGRLLCPFCLKQKRQAATPAAPPAQKAGDEPIALVDLEGGAAASPGDEPIAYDKKPTAVRSFGGGTSGLAVGEFAHAEYRRPLLKGVPNATRCRTFHCKLADGPIAHMSEQINEWVDADDDIEIKFATSTIGVIEGKHVDSHLIVNLFY